MEPLNILAAALAGGFIAVVFKAPTLLRMIWPARFAHGAITKAEVNAEIARQEKQARYETHTRCARCRTDDPVVFKAPTLHCVPCEYLLDGHRFRVEKGMVLPSTVSLDHMYDIGDAVTLVHDNDGYLRNALGIKHGSTGVIARFSNDTDSHGNKIVNSGFMVTWTGFDGETHDVRTERNEIVPLSYTQDRRALEAAPTALRPLLKD